MDNNKNHWYDGLFYEYFIAPNQDRAFLQLKKIITQSSSLVDIGCGTGRLAFQIEDKCSRIDGVDLSQRNINVARKKLEKQATSKIKFFHADISQFLSSGNHYDYAVLSYVIHEVDESLRVNLLQTLSQSADKIIIIDYLAPQPANLWRTLNEVVEFVAGREHYKNYKTYIKNNGINGLANISGLKIIDEIQNSPSSSHIAVLQK